MFGKLCFTLFTPEPRELKSYPFISINKSQNIGVSMPLTREMEEKGWHHCMIEYDSVLGVIKLIKCDAYVPEAVEVGWQHLKADLRMVMPRGRYSIFKHKKNRYYLKHEIL